MFGTGVFINTVNLAKRTGALGFLSYIIVALLMLPLILAVAQMVRFHPAGGFYAYAAHDVSLFAGFFSAWAYFTGKLASAALLIHVFSTLLQTIIPALAGINPLIIDFIILALFTWLNWYNLKTGARITSVFIFLKFTPIIFAILASIYLFNTWSLPPEAFHWQALPATLPLVLYAFVGFEVACSISASIQDADKNAPKAILYSFFVAVCITVLYQFVLFAATGTDLMALHSFTGVFPTLLQHISNSAWLTHLANLLNIAVATSALGGSYGILLSNSWNLYTLAQNKHVVASSWFSQLNKYGVPFFCVLAEIALCISYFLVSWGGQIALQQISVLGCTIAYGLTVLGLLKIHNRSLLPWLALVSCLLLFCTVIWNFLVKDTNQLFYYILLLVVGVVMFFVQRRRSLVGTNL